MIGSSIESPIDGEPVVAMFVIARANGCSRVSGAGSGASCVGMTALREGSGHGADIVADEIWEQEK